MKDLAQCQIGVSQDLYTVGVNFDIPLDRLRQRNSYRRAQIGLDQIRRDLDEFEDNLILDVRDSLSSLKQLKLQIESSIDSVTLLLSAIPLVGMIVAALGVANLMTANVASRSHEIAVLRAVGTTRSQVARIVVAEAVILGLLGSLVGVALGVYLGQTSNTMTRLLTGSAPDLTIPWRLVSAGAGLATLLCLLAALLPARYASRSNIVSALSAS